MRYAAGIKLFILGERLRERFDILAVAREDMARLRDETGQPATLSALVEDQVVVLEVLQGTGDRKFRNAAGNACSIFMRALTERSRWRSVLKVCWSAALQAAQSLDAANDLLAKCSSARRRASEITRLGHRAQSSVTGRERPRGADLQSRRRLCRSRSPLRAPSNTSRHRLLREQIRAVTQTAERISRKLGWSRR